MKSNKQGKIKVNKSGYKRSRFNWSHDVNTTFGWGEIQPTQCKMLIPGSKTTFKAQSLVRLAPMVAPTFGRVKYKTFNQFVSMAEIMPNFDAMMAQEPVSTAFGTRVPQEIPTVKLGILSSWVLQGCRGTLYFADSADDAAAGRYKTYYRARPNGNSQAWNEAARGLIADEYVFTVGISDAWNNAANGVLPDLGDSTVTIKLGKFGTNYAHVFAAEKDVIAMGCKSPLDMCPVTRSYVENYSDHDIFNNPPIEDYQKEVTFDSADYVLEGNYNGSYFALAVELGDFGKRIRKILQGCGYQINFTSTARVSILPLLAQFKAYFDIFGLELYQGWETTWCSKIIKYIENNFVQNCDDMFLFSSKANSADVNTNNSKFGLPFMVNEIGNMFYTDDVDYVSAHISSLSVSPNIDTDGFLGVLNGDQYLLKDSLNIGHTNLPENNNYNNPYESQEPNDEPGLNRESLGATNWMSQTMHTQVDAEMLKRLYKWTNRNTILGRRIAELLRAQGLGKYVDECKSNYIGSTDTIVTISDVVSTSWTEDASLGEYGGKGLQYTEDKTLSFENDCYGYWVTLATIVPESGYTQGLDPTLTSVDKVNLYNPDFDAVGMEATPKATVANTNYIVKADESADDNAYKTFGFVPRYSKFKVANNLVNGDFNRHGLRNTYMPYTLDKQINVNDYDVEHTNYQGDGNGGTILVQLKKSERIGNLPVAGNTWRYPTKYNWLGNFNRIFLQVGEHDDSEISPIDDTQLVGWRDYNNDNFLCHSIYDVQSYAPMKPIVDSYGLEEDDPDRAGAEFVSKA